VSFLESKEREKIEKLIRNEQEVQKELIEFRRAQRITTADASPTLVITPKQKTAPTTSALKVKVVAKRKEAEKQEPQKPQNKTEPKQTLESQKKHTVIENNPKNNSKLNTTTQQPKESTEHKDKKTKPNPLPLVQYDDQESDEEA